MESKNMICDAENGVCIMPGADNQAQGNSISSVEKPVKMIYYTDPICSSCWGIEPQLRKLKLEYEGLVEIEYRMGGLLPDWSYNSGGISKPSDVAHHWDEVSVRYDMPIDGDVWLEDPLASSYPPSIAFKAAQVQSTAKAVALLREMREQLFLQKKNITKWEHIEIAAQKAALDPARLKADYEVKAIALFHEDLASAGALGVRGFPTIFFVDKAGRQEMVYGVKPYSHYEQAITGLEPAISKRTYKTGWQDLFAKYPTLTSREFAELSGTRRSETEVYLQELYDRGKLHRLVTKNGVLWQST